MGFLSWCKVVGGAREGAFGFLGCRHHQRWLPTPARDKTDKTAKARGLIDVESTIVFMVHLLNDDHCNAITYPNLFAEFASAMEKA